MTSVTPWVEDVDIMALTDTDLEENRTQHSRISDSTFELHHLVATLQHHEGFENHSQACDYALRVELAHAIDAYDVSFEHEDYGIQYSIPPLAWLHEHPLPDDPVPLIDVEEVATIDMDDRTIGFTTTPTVYEMTKAAIDEGAYESVTDMVRSGVRRLLGRLA